MHARVAGVCTPHRPTLFSYLFAFETGEEEQKESRKDGAKEVGE